MLKSNLLPTLGVLVLLAPLGQAQAAKFTLCKGTYALCTSAACTPVAGKEGTVSCSCEVRTGYSAGRDACQPVKDSGEGKQVRSRYYPVKSFAVCANDRPWANCLDMPCIVDKEDPTKAKCACTTVNDQGPYVIVGDTYTPSTCTTGIISSATVVENERITDFLKTTNELEPFAIKILNPSQSERRLEPTGGKEPE
jgi:hypothetical protein